MDRTNAPGHVNHLFVAEDPTTNRPPTEITAQDLNAHQEELINIILAAQIAPSSANNAQVLAALQGLFLSKGQAGLISQNFSGLLRTLTPVGGALVREWADSVAATTGNIEIGVSYNCAVDPVTGVWAGRDIADICWLEKWADAGGVKEFWYAPTAVAGAVPAWSKVFSLDMVGGGMYLAQEAGHVAFFARSTAPAGYLKANGALISRATYANLFAAIGTTFGAGDGVTTFALPDLRGEFLRGFDDGRGADAGRTLGSWQVATAFMGDGDGANLGTPNLNDANHKAVLGFDLDTAPANATAITIGYTTNASSAMVTGMHTVGGASISTDFARTRPRNIALLACIKF